MKKITLLISLTIISLIGFSQNTHLLTGYDTYFEPDTLYIEPGDTVEFVSVGYHSATQIDSLDWENNNAVSNNGFYVGFGAPTSDMKFAIDNLGTFYYICVPHSSMGMKGIIISENNVDISKPYQTNYSSIISSQNNKLLIKNDNCDELTLMAISGKIISTHVLEKKSENKTIDMNNITAGTYIGLFKLGGKTLKAVKFIKQ